MVLFKNSIATTRAVVLSTLVLLGGSSIAEATPNGAGDVGILEVDVTNMPDLKNGQPSVAVNPRDLNNLVFVSTIFPAAPGLEPIDECFLAYSNDKGDTWTRVPWPMGDRPKCGEPSVAVDAQGTFYIDNNQINTGLAANVVNHNVVSRSQDGGRTWIGPVTTPLLLSGAPKLRVDIATGKVYAVAGEKWEYPSAISVSADGGQSFSEPRVIPGPMPCVTIAPFIPQACGYPGRELAVHAGILASASQEAGQPVNFHVSRDDGLTWTNTTVTDELGTAVPAGTGPLVPTPGLGAAAADPVPWVSADPSLPGRFAVMVPRDSTLEVYLTEDAGESWTGPSVIATPNAQRPWMDFGSNGDLGVMWRTTGDAFSIVSFDHGRSFSESLRVNQVTQPVGQSGPPGDRWSGITLADGYAYVAWSDGRNGSPLDAILSRVPLELYQRSAVNSPR